MSSVKYLDSIHPLPGVYHLKFYPSGLEYYGSSNDVLYRIKAHFFHLEKNDHFNSSMQLVWNFATDLVEVSIVSYTDNYRNIELDHIINNETNNPKKGLNRYPAWHEDGTNFVFSIITGQEVDRRLNLITDKLRLPKPYNLDEVSSTVRNHGWVLSKAIDGINGLPDKPIEPGDYIRFVKLDETSLQVVDEYLIKYVDRLSIVKAVLHTGLESRYIKKATNKDSYLLINEGWKIDTPN